MISVCNISDAPHSNMRKNEHTIDRCHDESNLHGVRCTCEVCVDLLRLVLVQADESVQDVVACRCVVCTTLVVWEVVLHWAHRQLLLEAINLVQKENNRRLDEPPRVANAVEKGESFLHTVDGLIFEEQLIVFRDGDKEENSGDVLEAVYPLLSFRSLSTNIEHAVCQIANDKGRLGDTSGLDTRSQDILVIWHVVWSSDSIDRVEVAGELIYQPRDISMRQ